MEPYRTLYPEAARNLPRTEAIAGRVIVLPTGTTVDESAIGTISRLLQWFRGGA